jgi:hypothetical protein
MQTTITTATAQNQKTHTPNKTRVLTTDAVEVQEHYLNEALSLLLRAGTLRVHGFAFALFPARSKAAALAAAQRVVANATKVGFIRSEDEVKTRHRYYALTAAGARHLRQGGAEWAESTTSLLKTLTRAHHREWTNMCAIAALSRGMESYAESDYFGRDFRRELTTAFEAVPDVLTFTHINNLPTAVWHEVELSRRSARAPSRPKLPADQKDLTGIAKFRQLLHTLRTRRVLAHNGIEYTLMLYVHCATTTLQSVLEKHLAAYARDHSVRLIGGDGVYRMPFDAKGKGELEISFSVLPLKGRKTEAVWHDTDDLPWNGVLEDTDRELTGTHNEQFMRTVE